jgi:hypothetical protein
MRRCVVAVSTARFLGLGLRQSYFENTDQPPIVLQPARNPSNHAIQSCNPTMQSNHANRPNQFKHATRHPTHPTMQHTHATQPMPSNPTQSTLQAALTQVLAEFDAAPADQRTIVALRSAIAARVYTKSFLDYGNDNFEMRYFITHQDKYQVCAAARSDGERGSESRTSGTAAQ